MRFWWMIPLVIVVVAGVTLPGWWRAHRGVRNRRQEGMESRTPVSLPRPAEVSGSRCGVRVRPSRWLVCSAVADLGVTAAPSDTYVKHGKSSSRDIVCLDASGSMLPYDSSR